MKISQALRVGVAAISASLFAAAAQAAPVIVTDTVSGGPGDWVYDFSVTNNVNDGTELYFFGVSVPDGTITSTPPGFEEANWDEPWTDTPSRTSYNVSWILDGQAYINYGQSLGGFEVTSTSSTPLDSVAWFAYGTGFDASNDGCFQCGGNPGYEGFTAPTDFSVPAPGAFALVGLGLIGIGGLRKKIRAL